MSNATTTHDTWRLGSLTVRRIGFGAMRLAQHGPAFEPGSPPRDRASAIRLLRTAVDLGVDHIDTASFYFSALRSANELINSALQPYPDDLVIATKVGPGRSPAGGFLPHARPEQLRGQVEQNLRELGRDQPDLVYLRVLGADPIAERFGALAELRTAGLIRELGVSNVRPAQLAEARAIAPVVAVQNPFGLGAPPEQRALLRRCGELGAAFVPFYALAGPARAAGRTAGSNAAEHPELLAVARAHGASPAQLRLAWTLHQGPHVLAIPGTGSAAHLAENLAAGALRLTPDQLALLDGLVEQPV
ncbi:aldo/keto reductase [Kitasatospora viridis]|uniref:Aryl-alcohol dehydrogenase-like predicted oxidoreductase n=1 Tax=Kitasatospora viridis TaxID=281105 RepID=A0A561UQE5_9ACTN|nr:aldo/keto reductase [Kitasatospora viridis]TWG01574.1 aryl-alcohol dehydrogenase-like predicted oxidoreductase [Kitasatospora viridis]